MDERASGFITIRAVAGLVAARGHRVSAPARDAAMRDRALGDEQRAAFRHVTSNRDLALVGGYAGTGKSTILSAAREAVESRTGAVAWAMRQRSVSRPRSSNRTCGFVG